MNLKKIIKINLLLAVFVMLFSFNVQASAKTMNDYLMLHKTAYQQANPTVTDKQYAENECWINFLKNDMYEGWTLFPLFDVYYYLGINNLNGYQDIKDHPYKHFVEYGLEEGRPITYQKPYDLSNYRLNGYGYYQFDKEGYLKHNPEIKGDAYFATHPYEHYLLFGAAEGRTANHTWDEGVVTKAANCKEDGVKTFTCKCGETRTEVIPKGQHDYSIQVPMSATCEEEGTYYYVCSGCLEPETIKNEAGEDVVNVKTGKLKHDFSLLTATVEPNCTHGGYRLYTCSLCLKATSTEDISKATAHDMEAHKAEAVSCVKDGNKAYWTCKNECDNYYYANAEGKERKEEIDDFIIKAEGHKYDIETVTKEATCDTEGEKTLSCSVCGNINPTTEPIAKLGHDLTFVKAKAATCSTPGNNAYAECKTCGKCFVEDEDNGAVIDLKGGTQSTTKYSVAEDGKEDAAIMIAADSNLHNLKTVTTPAVPGKSCKTTITKCQNPGCDYEVRTVAHTRGNKVVDATCESPAKYICNNCHIAGYEDGEALGHDWEVVTERTCTENAVLKCNNENCKYNTEKGTALDVIIANGSMTEAEAKAGLDGEPLKATGVHTLVTDDQGAIKDLAREATCTVDGFKENTYQCADCDAYFTTVDRNGKPVSAATAGSIKIGAKYYLPTTEEAVTIKAPGHEYDTPVIEAATCETDGKITKTCKNCNHEDEEIIPATGHAFGAIVKAKDPTCGEDGNVKYVVCANCKKYYEVTDEEAQKGQNGKYPVLSVKDGAKYYVVKLADGNSVAADKKGTEEAIVVPATEKHNYISATVDASKVTFADGANTTTVTAIFYCDGHKGSVAVKNVPLTKVDATTTVSEHYTITIENPKTEADVTFYLDEAFQPTTAADLGIE